MLFIRKSVIKVRYMYIIFKILYDNMGLVFALFLAILAAVCYLLFKSIKKDFKEKRRTWDKDKYRKY